MIILKQDDGTSLNLSAAQKFMDTEKGMIADMGDGKQYLTSIESVGELQDLVMGRFATMITIRGHFKLLPP